MPPSALSQICSHDCKATGKIPRPLLIRTLWILSIWSVVLPGCGTELRQLAPQESRIQHEAPKIKPGFYWKKRGWSISKQRHHIYEEFVESVKNDIITINVKRDGRVRKKYLNKNLRIVTEDGRPMSPNSQPSAIRYSFPLFVGKEWEDSYEGRNWRSGEVYSYENEYEVEAYERVQTKAGVFWAYRIGRRNYNLETGGGGWEIYWYAPVVATQVKKQTSWGTVGELLAYRLEMEEAPPSIFLSFVKVLYPQEGVFSE